MQVREKGSRQQGGLDLLSSWVMPGCLCVSYVPHEEKIKMRRGRVVAPEFLGNFLLLLSFLPPFLLTKKHYCYVKWSIT